MQEPFKDEDELNEEEDGEMDTKGKHPLFAQYNPEMEEYFKTKGSDAILQGLVITNRNGLNPKVRRLVLATTALRIMKMKKNQVVAEYPLSDIVSVKMKSKVCFRVVVQIHKKKTSLGGITKEEKITQKKIVFETPRPSANMRWINEIKKACGVAYNEEFVYKEEGEFGKMLNNSSGSRRARSISDPPTPTSARRKSPVTEKKEEKHSKVKKSLFSKNPNGKKHIHLNESGDSLRSSVDGNNRFDPFFDAPLGKAAVPPLGNSQTDLSALFAVGAPDSAIAVPVKRLNLSPRGTPPGSPKNNRRQQVPQQQSRSSEWLWDPLASPVKQKTDLGKISEEEFNVIAAKAFGSSSGQTTVKGRVSSSSSSSASSSSSSSIQPWQTQQQPPLQQAPLQPLQPLQSQQQPKTVPLQPLKPAQQPPQAIQGIVFSTMGVPKGFELVREVGVISGNASMALPSSLSDYHDAIEQARVAAQHDLFRIAQTHNANAVLNSGFSMSFHHAGLSVLAYGTACVLRATS